MSPTTSYTTTHSKSHHRNNPPLPAINTTTTNTNFQTQMGEFTYIGKETLYISNVLKHTDLKIPFRANNTIEYLLKQRSPTPNRFLSPGVYKLTYPDCHKTYVVQTGKQFYTPYKEHRSDFYHNGRSSNFALHLHDNAQPFGSIYNIMQVLHHQQKGTHLNTIERFHIHIEHTAGNHLNDDHTIFPNRTFDTS